MRALDLWAAFNDAVEEYGSVSEAVVNDPAATRGAFESHAIMQRIVPECVFTPSGD